LSFYKISGRINTAYVCYLLKGGVFKMARECEVCGKGKISGNNVSHANNHTRRTWAPNLRKVKAVVNGVTPKRLMVCTRCLRSGNVQRAI
jgi:large subunit ribosomal protein L28